MTTFPNMLSPETISSRIDYFLADAENQTFALHFRLFEAHRAIAFAEVLGDEARMDRGVAAAQAVMEIITFPKN